MPLIWDVTKCAAVIDGHNDPELTQSLIFQCMGNGMSGITALNAGEFYARQRIWNRVMGFEPFTIEQVYSYIGLETNVSDETETQWLRRLKQEMNRLRHDYYVKAGEIQRGES